MAKKILRRLKFDNDTIEKVCRLIAGHDDNPPLTHQGVRRAVVRIGIDAYPAIFALKRADILAQSEYGRLQKLEYLKQYEAYYHEIVEAGQCLTLKQLAVNGGDLIAVGIQPGPKLGQMLKELLEIVLEDPSRNTKEYLLAQINRA